MRYWETASPESARQAVDEVVAGFEESLGKV